MVVNFPDPCARQLIIVHMHFIELIGTFFKLIQVARLAHPLDGARRHTLASLDELRVYLDIFVERDDGNTATVDFVKVVLAAECSITKMYRRRL